MAGRRRRPHAAAPLALALVAVIAACGSGGAPAERSMRAPQASDAGGAGSSLSADAAVCALLTLEEAEAAFGQTFNTPVGQDGEPSECEYLNDAGFGLQVEVSRAPSAVADYEAAKEGFGEHAVDLPDVGDQAFEYFQGRRQVMFLKGDALVTIFSASRVDPEVFRELARTVAGRV
jgi:hypothetical protein